MSLAPYGAALAVALHVLVELALIVRVLLRPHRQPASRIAWVVVILVLPVVGILAYLLFGEVNIGRRRVARLRQVLERMPDFPAPASAQLANLEANVPERHAHLFRVGQSISGFEPVGGNSARLLADSNAAIDAMVADIDAAEQHVHLLFYIWLPDGNGCKIVAALKRAAARGVTCRAMADDLGSRSMIRSAHWQSHARRRGTGRRGATRLATRCCDRFKAASTCATTARSSSSTGASPIAAARTAPIRSSASRLKYAPWVDAMMRFEGPIAAQNQRLFASDWMTDVDEDLDELLRQPPVALRSGVPAQVIGTGPTVRYSAMPELFESLMHAARRELVITTPYYVPDESMQNALCAAAYRGVDTTIVFPARNDSWIVAAASHSEYADLLAAGVKVYEFVGGLLHTKSLTLDGEVALIGSANMDRRSFELNYENNILFCDPVLSAELRQRQQQYIARSRPVDPAQVAAWPLTRRLWNNTIAMLGPLL